MYGLNGKKNLIQIKTWIKRHHNDSGDQTKAHTPGSHWNDAIKRWRGM